MKNLAVEEHRLELKDSIFGMFWETNQEERFVKIVNVGNEMMNRPLDLLNETAKGPILLQNIFSLSPIIHNQEFKVETIPNVLTSLGGFSIAAFFFFAFFHFYIANKLFTLSLAQSIFRINLSKNERPSKEPPIRWLLKTGRMRLDSWSKCGQFCCLKSLMCRQKD